MDENVVVAVVVEDDDDDHDSALIRQLIEESNDELVGVEASYAVRGLAAVVVDDN